ncbi:ATP-binding cassette sub-family C member Sur isoform X2 [Drosophila obscura]|uniref:ATP-binding cassette sub-family C member Sur isoform X2 n=1 Tax=Drosophila obscura TaxID=7282 RepID=UPI001BB14F44|nr:ATP-binding cassette sub-family C member Sur isoform X2 [Drosophila obscura]
MTQLLNIIHCNNLNGRLRSIYEHLNTDVCGIDRVKLLFTFLSILLLLFGCAFVWKKYETCNKTLLMFHNLRAVVSLLMLAGNSLDLARSLLPQRSAWQLSRLFELRNRDTHFLIIIGTGETWNAIASTILTILLMCYYRVIECKKTTVFLYASITVEVLTLALRCDELTEVAYYEDLLELQTCLVGMSVLCLLVLASLDGYTIYNEHFRDNYVDENGKIGYKHSLATFYSKSCFWWLTPLLWLGHKKPLELEDLGVMKLEDTARSHYDHFLYVYTDEMKKSNSSPSLWYCYVKNSWRMFALGGILKLAGDLFALVGPLAIQQIVQYIEELYAQTTNPSTQSVVKGESGQALMLASNVSGDVDHIFRTNIGEVRIYYATWSELLTNGWSIAWIVLLAAMTQGALSQASTHILNMTGIWIKTSLQGLIYRKTLLLNASSGCFANNSIPQTSSSTSTPLEKEQNIAKDNMNTDSNSTKKSPQEKMGYVGDLNPSYDIGSITNHMTEDTLNIMQFFWIAHYAWAIPFKISVVIYFLYLKLGISAVIGAIVCILIMTPLQFFIGNAMSKNSEVIAKYTDERLKKIHETLIGIKVIKLNAWDEVFFKKIQVARKKELTYLNKDAIFWTLMTILTHISTVLITFVTLGVYVWLPREANLNLNASRLFSALALFQQLTVPLLIFPITVPIIIAARVSTRRLERFFEASEIQKQFEGIRNMARILSKSDASLDMYETQEKSNMTMRTAQTENMLNEKHIAQRIERPISTSAIEDNSLPITKTYLPNSREEQLGAISPSFFQEVGHQKLVQQRRELLRNTPYVAIRPPKLRGSLVEKNQEFSVMRARNTDSWRRDSLLLKMPDDIAVSINDGLFTWHPESHIPMVQLHIKGIVIPKGKLTVVVGKNGSGKTSLLSALLMEMPLLAGNMFWHKTSTISYVSQQPWLLNDTIRENILFGESFRPSRYDFVIQACALKPDIEIMPKSDFTIIGERGINLSGGQIQRIAIARAIYSSANVVIMDDPLSSLDNEVGDHIFQHCVSHMLLKSNRTFILVTPKLHHIKEADYVIVMKKGRLQACGSYVDIEATHPKIPVKWKSINALSNAKKQNDLQNHVERTASERWKLLKNVSKLGLQRSISVTTDENGRSNTAGHDDSVSLSVANMQDVDIEEDEEDNEISAPYLLSNGNCCSYNLKRKRSSVYGSRHLIYDVPLPIDECQADDVIMRPRRRQMINRRGGRTTTSWHRLSGLSTLTATSASSSNSGNPIHRSGLTSSDSSYTESSADGICEMAMPSLFQEPRIKSWQPKKNIQHQPLVRNASSPPAMEVTIDNPQYTELGIKMDTKTKATSEDQVHGSFQQFLRRMTMRRTNKPIHHHQPLSATNSILSISEESAATSAFPVADSRSLPSSSTSIYNPDAKEHFKPPNDLEGKLDKQLLLMNATEKSVNIDRNLTKEPSRDVEVSNVTSLTPVLCGGNMETFADTENELIPMSKSTIDTERKYGKISHQIYLMYIRASGVPIITVFFITALIWQCLRVYTDVWLQHWSDVHIQTQDVRKEEGHEVTYYFCMYAAISCVCIIMAMISTPAGQWAGCNARRNLHDKLLQSILHKTLHFFQVTPLGRIVNRFSNDMTIIDKKIAATCQRLLQFSLLCISAILINVSITRWFFAFTLPICGAYYIIQKFYRCSARELQRIENATNSPVISHLSETIQGVTTIRAYNQQARFTEIIFKRLEANTIAFALLNTSNRWLGISLDYLGGCIVFVAIVTSLATASISCSNYRYARDVAETYSNKSTTDLSSELRPTPSFVGLAINYTLLVPIYLNWVVKLLADMEMYAGSVERIAHYAKGQESDLEATEKISNEVDRSSLSTSMWTAGDKVYPSATTAAVDVDEDIGGDGENADKLNAGNATGDGNHLNLHTATAADKLQKEATKTSVIKDKKLPPHSGKVDLSNEPARRLESCQLKRYQSVPISWPQRGDISFQNVSLRYEGQTQNVISGLTLKIPSGQRIGICGRTGSGKSSLGLSLFGVLQITSGNIFIDEMNIKQIRPEELRTRLSIIPQDVHLFNTTIRENLDPHGYYSDLQLWNCLELAQLKEFVKRNLPLGLDTVIINGAINLSAGQRQLLCLARAILRGSVCLVLDEATSALDSGTETALLKAANKAFQGRTIIAIAHRLTTILEYDRLIVMENGRIIEDGNPKILQQLSGSAFNGYFKNVQQSRRISFE